MPCASLRSLSDNNGQLCPGVLFTEHVDMRGRGSNTIVNMRQIITTLEDMKEEEEVKKVLRVVWLGKQYPNCAVRPGRVHKIFEKDGVTLYYVYETLSGPLA